MKINNGLESLLARFSADDFDEVSKPFFEQAVSDTSLAVCITDPHMPDSPIIYANDAFCELTGYSLREIIGKNCRFLQGAGTTDESLVNLRAALEKKYLSVTELVNYRKDGTAFINALHMAPLFDTNGKMQLFYGSQMDTTETVTVNLARRKRAMKLSGIGIWEFTPVSKDSFFDNTMLDLFDIPQDQNDIVFDDLFSKVHADDHQRVRASSYAWFKDSTATYNEDFRIVLCNDQIRWIRCTGGMARASDGSGNQSVIGTAVDITREKEYELALSQAHDTIKTIADELDHRMNNVFATMASMVSASARGESDAKIAAAKTRERIMAMAVANKLTIGKGIHGEALLRDLITGALNPYMGTSTIEIDGEPVQLPRKTLNSLGLIFHELSTNSVKYGALNGAGGRLSVKWNVSDDGHCQIDWKEQNGKQYELPTASTGFGTNLVDLTVNQISGSIQRDFTKMGLEVRISFPLPKDP